MAFTYLPLAILVVSNHVVGGNSILNVSDTSIPVKATLDPKKTNVLVEEAFLEQKDILLDMLETKLKEVRDKKKKKNNDNIINTAALRCGEQPSNVDLSLKANGIVAVGETDVQLNFGETGNSTLNLNATGISNVGKAHLNLGIADGTIYIPGIDNLFIGSSFLKNPCNKQDKINNENESNKNEENFELAQSRRSLEFNNTSLKAVNDTLKDITHSVDEDSTTGFTNADTSNTDIQMTDGVTEKNENLNLDQ